MDYRSKIGLGTVQFGLPYGISNTNGQTSPEEITKILVFARQEGIDVIDTASTYGTSEKFLGKNNLEGFKIVSKFMLTNETSSILQQLNHSLNLLNVCHIYGYLAHRPKNVLENSEQWTELIRLKDSGLVQKIGFSFNEPNEINEVFSKGWIPDIVQVPFNYFDNRFNHYLERFKAIGCEVHTRSAFLQGLFFIQVDNLPSFFDFVKPAIKALQENGEKLPGLLLKHCLQQDLIDKVIIGVNSAKQLIANLNFINTEELLPDFSLNIPDEILTPSKWQINNQ